jgi:hypothetical protein
LLSADDPPLASLGKSSSSKKTDSLDSVRIPAYFGYENVTNGCGSADPKYCQDDVAFEFISCTHNEIDSYRKALPSDCTYNAETDTLSVLADRDRSNKSGRNYTIIVLLVDGCGNEVETTNTIQIRNGKKSSKKYKK